MRTTSKGLTVWDLPTDQFNHTSLSANWDLIDSLIGAPASQVTTVSTLPTSGNFAGRVIMLSGTDGGFQPWTLLRYDGTSWRPVGQMEIQPAVPLLNNYAGRVVILSNSDQGFPQWSIVAYNGSSWQIVGGWQTTSTGSGSGNISGLSTSGDVYITNSARGLILKDRTNSTTYRLYFNNGNLQFEQVT